MARTLLTVQEIAVSGTVPALAAAITDGHSMPNNGNSFMMVSNGHTAAHTVTFVHPGQLDGLAVADRTVSVAAGSTALIGPFSSNYNQPGTNYIHTDYDSTTALSVGVFRLG